MKENGTCFNRKTTVLLKKLKSQTCSTSLSILLVETRFDNKKLENDLDKHVVFMLLMCHFNKKNLFVHCA